MRFILYKVTGHNGWTSETPIMESQNEKELIVFAVDHAKKLGEAKFMEYPWGLLKNGLPRGYKIEMFQNDK